MSPQSNCFRPRSQKPGPSSPHDGVDGLHQAGPHAAHLLQCGFRVQHNMGGRPPQALALLGPSRQLLALASGTCASSSLCHKRVGLACLPRRGSSTQHSACTPQPARHMSMRQHRDPVPSHHMLLSRYGAWLVTCVACQLGIAEGLPALAAEACLGRQCSPASATAELPRSKGPSQRRKWPDAQSVLPTGPGTAGQGQSRPASCCWAFCRPAAASTPAERGIWSASGRGLSAPLLDMGAQCGCLSEQHPGQGQLEKREKGLQVRVRFCSPDSTPSLMGIRRCAASYGSPIGQWWPGSSMLA